MKENCQREIHAANILLRFPQFDFSTMRKQSTMGYIQESQDRLFPVLSADKHVHATLGLSAIMGTCFFTH